MPSPSERMPSKFVAVHQAVVPAVLVERRVHQAEGVVEERADLGRGDLARVGRQPVGVERLAVATPGLTECVDDELAIGVGDRRVGERGELRERIGDVGQEVGDGRR